MILRHSLITLILAAQFLTGCAATEAPVMATSEAGAPSPKAPAATASPALVEPTAQPPPAGPYPDGAEAALPPVSPYPGALPNQPTQQCSGAMEPQDGLALEAEAPLTFTWEAQAGAVSYRVEVIPPAGELLVLPATETQVAAPPLSQPGVYLWSLIALDASGAPLCASAMRAFTVAGPYPSPPSSSGMKEEPERPPSG
ncbi:MAG: hypothetical protein PHD58_04690 [Anaerolineales bacterium]|nr:hypothetical protein [Anaerolineales bacterium]